MPESLKPRRARWPRAGRLTRSDDIRATLRHGRRKHAEWFRLFFWPQASGYPRFAISVRKRVGNACQRNRERRRIKEALRIARTRFSSSGWGVVIIDQPAPPGLTGAKRNEIIAGLLANIQSTTGSSAK